MADYRYYPPIVDSYLPAFVADGSALKVYFGLSKYNSITDFSSVQVSVKKQNTGLSIVNTSEKEIITETQIGDGVSTAFSVSNDILVVTNVSVDGIDTSNFTVQNERTIEIFTILGDVAPAGSEIKITYQYQSTNRYRATGIILNLIPVQVTAADNLYYIEILNEDIKNGWAAGTIYQIQLRLSSIDYDGSIGESTWLNNNANNFSEWSTICVTKAIGTPSFIALIPGMENNVLNSSSLVFRGYYTNTDLSENLDNYKIFLIQNDEIIEETELLYPELPSYGQQYLSYTLKTELEDQNNYSLQVTFETINKYTFIQNYSFSVDYSQEDFNKVTLSTFENDDNNIMSFTSINQEEDDGRVCLRIDLDNSITFPLTLCIRRSDYKTNFTKWEDLKVLTLEEYEEYKVLYDYTIQSGVFYKYGIQKIDTETDGRSVLKIVENPVIRTFEFSFLLGENDQQLKLKFNNVMNNYKYNINEGKTDSIGGIYAFVSRNAKTYYQSFPINGLISFNMDENNLFITKEKLFNGFQLLFEQYNFNNNLGLYDMTYEREFRKEVLKFLLNGKPKLFKSPSEGNVIIRLLNVNCSPDKITNRLIYSFSSEAIEIAEDGLDNYKKYNFASGYEENILPTPPSPGPTPPGPTPPGPTPPGPTPTYSSSNILNTNILSNKNYKNIIFNFNSSTTYLNEFEVGVNEPNVYYNISNDNLYISTLAPSIYWNTALGDIYHNSAFSIDLEGNLQDIFSYSSFNNVENMYQTFKGLNKITGTAISSDNVLAMYKTYENCENLKFARCGNNVVDMISTYSGCKNLVTADCGSHVVNMPYAYANCLNLLDAKCNTNVINMSYTYYNCQKLEEAVVGPLVEDMSFTYANCNSLKNAICGISTTNLDYTYSNCANLENAIISYNVSILNGTFSNCPSLSMAICDDINVLTMNNTYTNCISLIDAVCGANVLTMDNTYANCVSLINAVCGENVINMPYAYANCLNLVNPVIGNNVRNLYYTYADCPNIQGDFYLNNNIVNYNDINMEGCFTNRDNKNQLNIWTFENSNFFNYLLTEGRLYNFENLVWSEDPIENYYFNSYYNTYMYYNLGGGSYVIQNYSDLNDYYPFAKYFGYSNYPFNVFFFFNNNTVTPLNLNVLEDQYPVYLGMEDPQNVINLYVYTQSDTVYFNTTLGSLRFNYSDNLLNIYPKKYHMFDKVLTFDGTFNHCNMGGTAICGPNTINLWYTYQYCYNLRTPFFSKNVAMAVATYSNCYRITEAASKNINNIINMNQLYEGCYNLKIGTIGEKVESLGASFYRCVNLTDLYCYTENSMDLGYDCFNGIIEARVDTDLNIYVKNNSWFNNRLFYNFNQIFYFGWSFQNWQNENDWEIIPNGYKITDKDSLQTVTVYYNLTNDTPIKGAFLETDLNGVQIENTYTITDGDSYNKIIYHLNNDILLENNFKMSSNGDTLVTYNIDNNILHIASKANNIYFGCYQQNYHSRVDDTFRTYAFNFENANVSEFFNENSFGIEMPYSFGNNIIGTAICGRLTRYFQETFSGANINEAVCGPNVISMSSTYSYCNYLTDAVCGPRVIRMGSAYWGCSNLKNAVCGPNVEYMYGTYSNCPNLTQAAIGENVTNAVSCYQNCWNLTQAISGNKVNNYYYTYYNCYNIQGNFYLYNNNINYEDINMYYCFSGRNTSNPLNIWVKNNSNFNSYIYNNGRDIFGFWSLDWTKDVLGYYNEGYNIFVYPSLKDNINIYDVTILNNNILKEENYNNIVYLLGNTTIYNNQFETNNENCNVYYEINNNTLYISTEASLLYWNDTFEGFSTSLQENLTDLFSLTMFKKVSNMDNLFRNSKYLTGNSICLPNTISLNNTYENCSNITYGAGLQYGLLYMDSAYAGCTNLQDALIGYDVISLNNTFSNTNLSSPSWNFSVPYNVKYMINTFADSKIQNATFSGDMISAVGAFRNCYYLINNTNLYCRYLTNMSYTFTNCINLPEAYVHENVKDISFCYDGCLALEKAVTNIQVNNLYCTYANCPNIQGNFYIYSDEEDNILLSDINMDGCFINRNNENQLNIWVMPNSNFNKYLYNNAKLYDLTSNISWIDMDNGYYNEYYNTYVYYNTVKPIPNVLNVVIPNWDTSYSNIIFNFNSNIKFENKFEIDEGEKVYWNIENNNLYIATKAPTLYWQSPQFSSNLEGNIYNIFDANMFTTTLENSFRNSLVSGKAFCTPNILGMKNAYYNCQFITEAVCGENVTDLSYAYYNCDNITNAVCGNNVVNMAGAYCECNNITEAICGNNVLYLGYNPFIGGGPEGAYQSCPNITTGVCGNNVIDMTNAYRNCVNITSGTIGENVSMANNVFYQCNKLTDIYIYRTSNIMAVNMISNSTSIRRNIWIKPSSNINTQLWSSSAKLILGISIMGGSVSWVTDAQGYHNTQYNIYVKYF